MNPQGTNEMKASEIFSEIGNLIVQHYNHFKIKYLKSMEWVRIKNGQFEFMISFSTFSYKGKLKNIFPLSVNFIIDDTKIKAQLIHISLWQNGHSYEIDKNNYNIKEIFDDIIIQADLWLIPFIKKFEKISEYKNEWINHGFLGIEFPFEIDINFVNEYYGREAAEECLTNYYNSLNDETKKNFKKVYECGEKDIPIPNNIHLPHKVERNYFNYSLIKDSVELKIKLK